YRLVSDWFRPGRGDMAGARQYRRRFRCARGAYQRPYCERDSGRRDLRVRRDEGTGYPLRLCRPRRSQSTDPVSGSKMKPRAARGDEWWRPMPSGTSGDALRVLAARGVRAFGDGFVALLLPIYLVELGFSALAVGAIVTSTLIGTAILTLGVGWVANRYSRRLLLVIAAVLMAVASFATITKFCPLLAIAFVGTI